MSSLQIYLTSDAQHGPTFSNVINAYLLPNLPFLTSTKFLTISSAVVIDTRGFSTKAWKLLAHVAISHYLRRPFGLYLHARIAWPTLFSPLPTLAITRVVNFLKQKASFGQLARAPMSSF